MITLPQQAAQAALSEPRDQLRQRIDQAKVDVDLAATDARAYADELARTAGSLAVHLKSCPYRAFRQPIGRHHVDILTTAKLQLADRSAE